MTDSTRDMLTRQLQGTHDTLEKLREHIEEGCNYGTKLLLSDAFGLRSQICSALDWLKLEHASTFDGLVEMFETDPDGIYALADSEDAGDLAEEIDRTELLRWEDGDLRIVDPSECDICSQYPDETPEDAARIYLDEYPLEAVAKIGRPLTVVFGTGGPHIEIEWDLSNPEPRLMGYWSGTVQGPWDPDLYRWTLDYFIDPSQYED